MAEDVRVGSILRAVLLVDAVFTAAIAVVLLAATWDHLYHWLGIRGPAPAPLVQLAGALLVGLAILLCLAAVDATLVRGVSIAAAAANAVAALVVLVWFASGEGSGFAHASKVKLISLAVVFAAFTAAEAAAALQVGRVRPPQ